jgi:hypothetical protein
MHLGRVDEIVAEERAEAASATMVARHVQRAGGWPLPCQAHPPGRTASSLEPLRAGARSPHGARIRSGAPRIPLRTPLAVA